MKKPKRVRNLIIDELDDWILVIPIKHLVTGKIIVPIGAIGKHYIYKYGHKFYHDGREYSVAREQVRKYVK